jgi:peptide/nickel transport system substrate-binding protein
MPRPALVAVAALAVALTGCGADSTSADGGGGDPVADAAVVLASSAITTTLDPAAALSSVGRTYSKQVFDTLVSFDGGGELQPGLATEWERIDDTAIEFTLREDVTFSNGSELTAEDVVANVERVLSGDPAYAVVAGRIATVKGAEAVSEDVVRVETTGPDPVLLNRLTLLDIVDPDTFGEERPAGTGPFEVTEYQENTSITLTRVDSSWRAGEGVKDLTIQAIPNPTTLASALRTGEVDIAFGLPADASTQLESSGFRTIASSAGSAAINSLVADAEPMLEDPRVREAINLSIDREAFVDAALGGFGAPNGSQFLQEGYVGFDPDLPHFEYDLDRAKELIAEAGAEGLELPIATTALFKTQAEAVAGFLNAAGFKSEVVIEDLSAFIPTLLQQSKYPLLYWQTDYYELRDIVSVTRFGPPAPGQQSHFDNARYQELFTQQAQEMDADERESMIQEMARIMREEAGVLFLAWPDNLYTAAPHIDEVPLSGDSLVVAEEIVVSE